MDCSLAHQAPLFMGFSRQEYWSGLPLPPPEDLPDLGLRPGSPVLAGGLFTAEPPGKPYLLQFLLHTVLLCPTFMEEEPRGQAQEERGATWRSAVKSGITAHEPLARMGKEGAQRLRRSGPE